jgi:PadR family transcriptional regulator, regulatory protein PadR
LEIHNTLMYFCVMYSSELIKGTLKTIILKLLNEQKEMYGYEITKKVEELTHGKIQITEGALYPILHKMEADGLLTTREMSIGKRIRKYYSVTSSGKTESAAKTSELLDFIRTMETLLQPQTGLSTS